MAKKAPKPNGRPTLYSEAISDRICNQLIDGHSMRQICAAADMPHRSTVIRWMGADEAFATKCAHARALQADYMDDLILDTANGCTPETAQADRVKISAYQWRASKLAPKKYGEKLELSGNAEAPLAITVVRFSDLPKPG